MKIRLHRTEEEIDVQSIMIMIGSDRYRLSVSVDNRIIVNKTSDGDSESISVHPRYSNEIEIS